MSKKWYQQSIDVLQLNGKGERTQKAYTRALHQFGGVLRQAPGESESELQAYFLHRRNVDGWSPNTMRICYCGIRFFFVNVLKRDWIYRQQGALRIMLPYLALRVAEYQLRWPGRRTFGLTGRRRAKRDGNQTAQLFGAPVERGVRRQHLSFGN
jgi:hypothetical protein